MGVWIETFHGVIPLLAIDVTPRVGVWIETFVLLHLPAIQLSLPAWECGLKLVPSWFRVVVVGHSPRGSVD